MKYIAILFLFFSSLSMYSQETISLNFEILEQLHEEMNFDSITKLDENTFINAFKEKTGEILELYANSFDALNQDDKALDYLKRAKKHYKQIANLENEAKINAKIWHLLNSQKNLQVDQDIYVNELKDYIQQTNSQKLKMAYYNIKGIDNFNPETKDSSKVYFQKALQIAEDIDSLTSICNLHINLGVLHLVEYKFPDSAIYHYKKALKSYEKYNGEEDIEDILFALYNNLGNAYRDKKKYKEALSYYKLAEQIDLRMHNKMSKRILFSNMDATYYYMNDWKNAYDYLYKYDSVNQLLEIKEQNTNIADIEEKYNNEKLRANNLEIEAKRIQNRNIAYGLGGSLLLGSIILFLVYSNFKRRQKLSKQEQEIENQKIINQLKEQELKAIDAMIEGQEKERQRIANDLHDDLGGLMATVKLHFNAFKEKNNPELYDKTNLLIDEAYQKVRTIAHAKNAGVIAKQGLLKAVQNMANTISASNQIQIEVLDHGLDDRLENSLELTIFRIIQELITNIIKHAEATKACIHLTNHRDSLNIMVEDNGKGFNPSQVTKTNAGMGISSIDKRIAHLGGSMTIESDKKQGATVIIDIPL